MKCPEENCERELTCSIHGRIKTTGNKSASVAGYKPWRHYADGCPWKQWRDEMLCCNGNIDDCGVYGPCNEEECALYHFMKGL